MPPYSFYPARSNGLADTFETIELNSDAEAAARARRVLADHKSAASVVAYRGHRQVAVIRRTQLAPEPDEMDYRGSAGGGV